MAQGQKRGSNTRVVPEAAAALNAMKYEIAAELGIPVGKHLANYVYAEFATELGSIPASAISEDYWGHLASRDAGSVGGQMTKRLVEQAEQLLRG